jgi:hypothetical protein
MTPRGGTELQLEFLQKHIDKSLLDNFKYVHLYQVKYLLIQVR